MYDTEDDAEQRATQLRDHFGIWPGIVRVTDPNLCPVTEPRLIIGYRLTFDPGFDARTPGWLWCGGL